MKIQKTKGRILILSALIVAVAIAAAALVFASCALTGKSPSKQTETPAPETSKPEETTAVPSPTASPEEQKYMPVSAREASARFQEYYNLGHAQHGYMVEEEINVVKAQCEALYREIILNLKSLYNSEFYSWSSSENYYEHHVKPMEEYYAKKVEFLDNYIFETYDMFYATYAMGGNSSGDAAQIEEYCCWTEFRYELYLLANY